MKVLIALSGGIDSAVSAALLKKQGHEIIGIHLQFWNEDFLPKDKTKQPENKCCSLNALETARVLCGQLEIPFYVLNFRKPFYESVVRDFTNCYGSGGTPNPCIVCNRTIKFGLLLQKMKELGAEAVATGHFARVIPPRPPVADTPPIRGGWGGYELHRGADSKKDQSYFLYHLSQEKLQYILFPVGSMPKSEVRKIAKKMGLPHTSGKKESQGACFFPEEGPREFLRRNLPKKLLKSGPIQTRSGRVIGEHLGLPLYTIGQRRGVDLGGLEEPYYVVDFDYKQNVLLVGPDEETLAESLTANNLSWVSGRSPAKEFDCEVQIRYRMTPVKASVKITNKKARVSFQQPARAVTPGQSIVFYERRKILGGGIILE